MANGRIIRFNIATCNPYFKERFGETTFSKQCKAPKNLVPHWCICEPIIRKHISKGERLFFVKKGTNFIKGILTVQYNASEQEAKNKLQGWYSFHKKQVCEHGALKKVKHHIPRSGNIIIGDPNQSFWIKREVTLDMFRDFLPCIVFDKQRQMNITPKFTSNEQVDKLYTKLRKFRPEN